MFLPTIVDLHLPLEKVNLKGRKLVSHFISLNLSSVNEARFRQVLLFTVEKIKYLQLQFYISEMFFSTFPRVMTIMIILFLAVL